MLEVMSISDIPDGCSRSRSRMSQTLSAALTEYDRSAPFGSCF